MDKVVQRQLELAVVWYVPLRLAPANVEKLTSNVKSLLPAEAWVQSGVCVNVSVRVLSGTVMPDVCENENVEEVPLVTVSAPPVQPFVSSLSTTITRLMLLVVVPAVTACLAPVVAPALGVKLVIALHGSGATTPTLKQARMITRISSPRIHKF